MDSNNRFRYTTLSEGSFFGEMSLLLNEENEYSYSYNLYEKVAILLFINAETFNQICSQNQGDSKYLQKIAKQRKVKFNKFKKTVLLSHMKAILKKGPSEYQNPELRKNNCIVPSIKHVEEHFQLKISIIRSLVVHYYLKVIKTHLNFGRSRGSPAKNQILDDEWPVDLNTQPVKIKIVLEKLHKILENKQNQDKPNKMDSFTGDEEEEQPGMKEAASKYTLDQESHLVNLNRDDQDEAEESPENK